jgi:amino-acid N-acetyltransferase
MPPRPPAESFSEKGFYLSEFRGRTIAIAARGEDLEASEPLRALLDELRENATRVVLLSDSRSRAKQLVGGAAVSACEPRFEGAVWRALAHSAHAAVVVASGANLARECHAAVLRLGLAKLMWVDREGGLQRPDGTRVSFVDLEQLRRLLDAAGSASGGLRHGLLREIEAALSAGVAAVNLSSLEGLADELFSYAGSGTLFTRERYVEVRRLGLDDFDAAADLIARGVAEGYLAERAPEDTERILGNGLGAFVEGRYLAGIGALLEHPGTGVAEIASLYTLTRFLGEGVGGHLIRFALALARQRGWSSVIACTTSERVVGFFRRQGFEEVPPDALPAEKWRGYDPERREHVRCLRHDLR